LGGALGLAVLGSLGIAVYRNQVAAALPPGISPEVVQAVQETLGGAAAVATQLPEQLGTALLSTAHQAFVQGLQLNAVIGVISFIGLAILTVTLLRHVDMDTKPEPQPNPEPDGLAAARACVQ
jgi:DHA2 family multidrug resistance protein-like MFS transporter